MLRYETHEDVNMRLSGSLIRWNGTPVYAAIGDGTKLLLHDILNQKHIATIDANDPSLDISSPPLGFVNDKSLLYVSRIPFRRQKQGLDGGSLRVLSEKDAEFIPSRRTDGGISLGFSGICFSDTLLGRFPDFKDAVYSAQSEKAGKAFSHRFAVSTPLSKNVFGLFHTTHMIGVYMRSSECGLIKKEYLPYFTKQLSQFMQVEEL